MHVLYEKMHTGRAKSIARPAAYEEGAFLRSLALRISARRGAAGRLAIMTMASASGQTFV